MLAIRKSQIVWYEPGLYRCFNFRSYVGKKVIFNLLRKTCNTRQFSCWLKIYKTLLDCKYCNISIINIQGYTTNTPFCLLGRVKLSKERELWRNLGEFKLTFLCLPLYSPKVLWNYIFIYFIMTAIKQFYCGDSNCRSQ